MVRDAAARAPGDAAWADGRVPGVDYDALFRGLLGLLAVGGLFAAATWRFAAKEAGRGPADVGLD
ncbi:MAG: hypothetical protein JWL64_2244 [Frankiales bacterium]|nr:hypothetical protein [Frankiales bacterium]